MSESKILGMMAQAAAKRQECPHISTDLPAGAAVNKAEHRGRFAMLQQVLFSVAVQSALDTGECRAYTGTNRTADRSPYSGIACSDRTQNRTTGGANGAAAQGTLTRRAHIGTAAERHNAKNQRERRQPAPPVCNSAYEVS